MKLRGITFKPCWDAAGVRGWEGEGYWFHHLPFVTSWLSSMKGSTFVSKTATIPTRIPPAGGIMPIAVSSPWEPREIFPRCIWVSFRKKQTVNAVGLSGPGVKALFRDNFFRKVAGHVGDQPFQISFMAVGKTLEARLAELEQFITLLLVYLPFGVKVAVQINISCPNTGHATTELITEAHAMLDGAQRLINQGIPVIVKVNLLAPIEAVKEIAAHPNCDALCATNAIPLGDSGVLIPWSHHFPKGSPVRRRNEAYGNGGYSGLDLLPPVGKFIAAVKDAGVTKPWNAGGGIRSGNDVEWLVRYASLERGKDSVFFASAAMVCPWNVPGIIEAAHAHLG